MHINKDLTNVAKIDPANKTATNISEANLNILEEMTNDTTYTYQSLTSQAIAEMDSKRTLDETATNISEANLKILREMATANQIDIITRPVNSTAFNQLQKGAVGKNMFVHGKSADRGLANGLIPLNASISKAGKDGILEKIQKFQGENSHSLEHSQKEFERIQEKLTDASTRLKNEAATKGETPDLTTEALLKLDNQVFSKILVL